MGAIASLNTGFACLLMYYVPYYQKNVSSFVFPAVIIFTISWMVASFFMMVLQVAVDAVFLCFLIDETVHQGSPKFASHKLQSMAATAQNSYVRMEDDEEREGKKKGRPLRVWMPLQCRRGIDFVCMQVGVMNPFL